MSFPENGEFTLYYEEDGERRSTRFEPTGALRASDTESFELKTSFSRGALGMSLRQAARSVVRLGRLEIVRRADAEGSFPLHPSLNPRAPFRLFQHGFQSWSLSASRGHMEADLHSRLRWKHNVDENPETPLISRFSLPFGLLPDRGAFHSEGFIGLEEKSPEGTASWYMGTAGPGNQFVRFRILFFPDGRIRELAAIWDFNGQETQEHARLTLAPVFWRTDKRSFAGHLDACTERASESFDHPAKRKSISGWCSWYQYYTDISQEVLLKNLRLISEQKLDIDVFQIDDGYQRTIGDWTSPNEKFPSGLDYLAREIRRHRMTPGIWLAPFLVRPDAKVTVEHPEMVLRDDNEEPVRGIYNPLWGGDAWCLDVTHPAFKAWISETIHTIVHVWGYPYLKLDFLYAAVYRGRHHDRRTTGATRLRNALEMIRKAAGKDTFLVGCGCPIYGGAGIVDAMRVSCDVNSVWDGHPLQRILRDRNFPTARSALINSITRAAMHRRFWLNDPDCLMVRTRKTKLTPDQVQLIASVMALAGGMILVSDDFSLLDAGRIELVRRAIALNRECGSHTAVPIGLMDHEFPDGLYNPAGYLGLWNPTPRPERVRFLLPDGLDGSSLRRAKDYWTGDALQFTVMGAEAWIVLGAFESVVARV